MMSRPARNSKHKHVINHSRKRDHALKCYYSAKFAGSLRFTLRSLHGKGTDEKQTATHFNNLQVTRRLYWCYFICIGQLLRSVMISGINISRYLYVTD